VLLFVWQKQINLGYLVPVTELLVT
jgi:hypothetical protein